MSSCLSNLKVDETLIVRWFKRRDYSSCWQAMRQFTDNRTEETLDEIWFLEHAPVFTQGQNGKAENILRRADIPIIQTDRGGQVTYHGPGQLMVYTLFDIKRKKLSIRQFVTLLEQSVIDLLADFGAIASNDKNAPGVYIHDKKICSIGLRVRRGCAYHGLAFNVDMDLKPFQYIHPCGFKGLKMTQVADVCDQKDIFLIGQKLVNYLMKNLSYTTANYLY